MPHLAAQTPITRTRPVALSLRHAHALYTCAPRPHLSTRGTMSSKGFHSTSALFRTGGCSGRSSSPTSRSLKRSRLYRVSPAQVKAPRI